METAALDNLYRLFAAYVKTFYCDDAEIQPKILQKEEHSFIVAGLSGDLARSLGLDDAETRLAEAIGLCHDFGRFRQATVYRTFRDADSVDHGRLGVEEMLAAGVSDLVRPNDWEALAFAVRWHNAAALPASDPRLTLHGRIIRDTDKLDICRVLPPAPPATGCSPQLEETFLAGKLLYYEDIRTADDRKLVMLSWLFDVNFSWTAREIAGRGYIDRLLASLPPSAAMPAIRDKIGLLLAEFDSRKGSR
ncbi:MAG: HD domain-containing protein [Sporomusaceae bacterium]|nr:HD domain-containing protein [Sporomusaceae bacterium]